ncbi:hypothetical protein CDV31_009568 [Fusarium ambrosium]|uniref:Uncharacterized protein n=1 Tax=Fusarium ambrosium TaxID=131363 RepID=A0A428TTR5_9HYPO|nr:hypothetical protein CDV31_009568 [Fusarium ambrosium]
MSEDVCKAAYHDSMYNAVAAERARGEVEAWMKVVKIEKKIEFEFQNCSQQEDHLSCDMDGKLARVSPQILNKNLQDVKQQLEQLTRDERKANENFIALQVRYDMGKRADQGLDELAQRKEYAQPGQGTDVPSQLDITLKLQQEATAQANERIRRCLDEFKVSEQQVEDAKMALLETQKQVEDAKATVKRVERLKDVVDIYAQWRSDERRLQCLEIDRALLEVKQERIGQRLKEVDQEKTQLLVKQEMSRGERELLWKDMRKGRWFEKGWLVCLEPEEK